MILSDHNAELLFEVTEWHLKWYELYYENPPQFSTLLEINFIKLESVSMDNWVDDDYERKLLQFKYSYIDMYEEELGINNNNDNDIFFDNSDDDEDF
jgi:hypothetical protein